MRGIYLDGIVLDEYADMDPRVWSEIIRPALADRQGWAVFIGTPKGRNGFFELLAARSADGREGWFSMMLRANEHGSFPAERARARAARPQRGAIRPGVRMLLRLLSSAPTHGKLMTRAEIDRRIAAVPHDPSVSFGLDLGIRDATAIWSPRWSGARSGSSTITEASGVDLGHYVSEINARPYVYTRPPHRAHDAQAKELGTGRAAKCS